MGTVAFGWEQTFWGYWLCGLVSVSVCRPAGGRLDSPACPVSPFWQDSAACQGERLHGGWRHLVSCVRCVQTVCDGFVKTRPPLRPRKIR